MKLKFKIHRIYHTYGTGKAYIIHSANTRTFTNPRGKQVTTKIHATDADRYAFVTHLKKLN